MIFRGANELGFNRHSAEIVVSGGPAAILMIYLLYLWIRLQGSHSKWPMGKHLMRLTSVETFSTSVSERMPVILLQFSIRLLMPSSEPPSTAASIIPEIGSDPVAAVRAGLPYAAVEHVQDHLEAPDDLLARALGISLRTLSRRREAGKLTTGESDRLVLLAEIIGLARRALDGAEAAREWLSTPHSMLEGESPLDYMDTVAGMEEVKKMLYHIEYGIPA